MGLPESPREKLLKMTAPDREQLERDLSDALSALQKDQTVLGLDELVASLTTLGPTYAFHGRLMQSALEATPRQYSALIWNVV